MGSDTDRMSGSRLTSRSSQGSPSDVVELASLRPGPAGLVGIRDKCACHHGAAPRNIETVAVSSQGSGQKHIEH